MKYRSRECIMYGDGAILRRLAPLDGASSHVFDSSDYAGQPGFDAALARSIEQRMTWPADQSEPLDLIVPDSAILIPETYFGGQTIPAATIQLG